MLSLLLVLLGTFLVACSISESSIPEKSLDLTENVEGSPIPAVPRLETTLPGMLYPRESESREVKSLDGLWDFLLLPGTNSSKGYEEALFTDELSKAGKVMQMPVPSSYNDITTSNELRDHVGVVWYQKTFFAPTSWRDQRVFIRFGSVNYLAKMWLNGASVTTHEMGHLPFEAELTGRLILGGKNRITLSVDNSLIQTSVPQGKITDITTDNGTVRVQSYTFDFFNYAGIHRPVLLYTKPNAYVADISVNTGFANDTGYVSYAVNAGGLRKEDVPNWKITLLNVDGTPAINEPAFTATGTLKVPLVKLWWPRTMDPNPGYLYTLEVKLSVANSEPDVYRLPFGIRTLKWTNTKLLLNSKPVYMRGFGRHEDSVIRGRGLDLVTMARDYELLQWVGANAYRTSHYPYSDEVMDMADRLGFLIVDECPSVDTENFSPELLTKHKQSLSELLRRDKNRPSVILWSLANEPRSALFAAEDYFKAVAEHTKSLDPTRPVTIAIPQSVQDEKVGQFLDVISFNRYNAWYSNTGRLDMIERNVIEEAEAWHKKHNKPVLMSEYGADTMPGLHELPAYVWSEEYQRGLLSKHFAAFDHLRKQGFFIGEFIWNFADFRTAQTYTRVGGNKKGIFTRDRQPKMAAYEVRKRYHALAQELDNATLPADLECYVSRTYHIHSEL